MKQERHSATSDKTDRFTPPASRDRSALPIDTSRMNRAQAAAMSVAEAARDESQAHASFAAELMLGKFRTDHLLPFPRQSDQERAIGDEMVESVSTFLKANLDPDKVDETCTIPDRVVKGLQRLGVFRMKVPTEYGGLGFSQVNYNRVILAIASHCASTAVLVSAHQSIGAPQPLKMFGTDEQKRKYLPRISEGAISAFALTEASVGSDPARMETTAVKSDDGKHYTINGDKQWTTNGPIADLIVVMARTGVRTVHGVERPDITAFIVEGDSPGVETLHRCDFMGIRGIQNGIIRFRNVVVPAENIIMGEGRGLRMALQTLNFGRLTLPAACAGLGKQCLGVTRKWCAQRVQWGLPIGEHEAGADKVADIASSTFAMESVANLSAHWADEGRDIRIEAAMAKLFCSETAWRVVDMTMQMRGGRGYERAASLRARGEDAYPVERMMRDCRINTIIEGASDIMRLYLAREALDPHLKRAADLLRRDTPAPRKALTACAMAGFYAHWLPARWVGARISPSHSKMDKLAPRFRFIDRASSRLASALVAAMMRHGPALEKRQIKLGLLIDIGVDLFAMSAVCANAVSLRQSDPDTHEPEQLADEFCRRAQSRIGEAFRALRHSNQRTTNALAASVLSGDHKWLEKGVIRTDDAA